MNGFENAEPSEKRDIRLYLDEKTIEVLQDEAARIHLSFSAYIRTLRRFFSGERIELDKSWIEERERLRIRMAQIIMEESGRV